MDPVIIDMIIHMNIELSQLGFFHSFLLSVRIRPSFSLSLSLTITLSTYLSFYLLSLSLSSNKEYFLDELFSCPHMKYILYFPFHLINYNTQKSFLSHPSKSLVISSPHFYSRTKSIILQRLFSCIFFKSLVMEKKFLKIRENA